MKPRRALRVLAFALSFAALGCNAKPQPGGQCTSPGSWRCVDEQTALYCQETTYVPIPCRGPRGCSTSATTSSCDDNLAEEGEACMQDENHACSVDHRRALACKDKKWTLWHACKGADGCAIESKTVQCDSSLADPGDRCVEHGRGACSVDKKFLLVCTERDRWERDNSCRGPEGCHLGGKKLALCDESVANEADPCDTPDERTCTMDAKSQLVCKAGKFVKEKDCKAKCVYTTPRDPPRCDY